MQTFFIWILSVVYNVLKVELSRMDWLLPAGMELHAYKRACAQTKAYKELSLIKISLRLPVFSEYGSEELLNLL